MKIKRIHSLSPFSWLVLTCFVLAFMLTAFTIVSYKHLASDYEKKSLTLLHKQTQQAREKFNKLLADFKNMENRLTITSLLSPPSSLMADFRRTITDPETEGSAVLDDEGHLTIWSGKVLSLETSLSSADLARAKQLNSSFIIKDKASVFLVRLKADPEASRLLAQFKLLAYIPQFQSLYLKESHQLGHVFKVSFDIDYWDFRDDLTGFESFFSANQDFYIGKSLQKNGIQSVFFPLRNENGQILATVKISSPPLIARIKHLKEKFAIGLIILAMMVSLVIIIYLGTSDEFTRQKKATPGILILIFLSFLRYLFFLLTMPGVSVYFPVFELLSTPGDVFLTALFLSSAALVLYSYRNKIDRLKFFRFKHGLKIILALISGAAFAAGLIFVKKFINVSVYNSRISFHPWPVSFSSLLMYAGLFALIASLSLVLISFTRKLAFISVMPWKFPLLSCLAAGLFLLALNRESNVYSFIQDCSLVILFIVVSSIAKNLKRKEFATIFLALTTFWIWQQVDRAAYNRSRKIIQSSIRHIVASQETWGKFLLEQSFPEIEKNERAVISFLKSPNDRELARSLWAKTYISRLNWYSCLEIEDSNSNILSRFSLNIPELPGSPPKLWPSERWTISQHYLEFLGTNKEYLVGHRDFFEDNNYLGRIIIYLAIDPDMLPFVYSANPYFEALRANPLPSLEPFSLGFAIYTTSGEAVFNPQKISWRLTANELNSLASENSTLWSAFKEGGLSYDAFLFKENSRIYVIYQAHQQLRTRLVTLLRLFFFFMLLSAIIIFGILMIRKQLKLKNLFRSFSNRVYASFLIITLIPLILLSIFTSNLFNQMFTRRFVEDASSRAVNARNLMEAFLKIQNIDISPNLMPSEDLALWISSALKNDVNIYSDGLLMASSRNEFFSTGLLPELLDGEVYFSLVYEKKPFAAKKMAIGGYSFQTLTIPYHLNNLNFFISLPFPFEKQQIQVASAEIVEFLVLISSFFLILIIIFSRSIKTLIIVPVRKLLGATQAISLGNLDVEISHDSRDEMMTLIQNFNTMIRNLKKHKQELADVSKKMAWAEMASKVAHEIKNPLTPIQLSAEHVLKVYEDKRGDFDRTLRESISYIISEVENLRHIAQEFMELARDTSFTLTDVDVSEIMAEVIQPYEKVLQNRIKMEISREGENFTVQGDPAKLKTAFRNIISNAVEAIPEKGRISIRMARKHKKIIVIIRDTGQGMNEKTLARIFEPYYSTKESGTGLGLPICKKILEEHGGLIEIKSGPGEGTEVLVELPAD